MAAATPSSVERVKAASRGLRTPSRKNAASVTGRKPKMKACELNSTFLLEIQ